MRERSRAQKLRLLLDNLNRAAADVVEALGDPTDLGLQQKVIDLLNKAPEGLRSWKEVITKAYEAARDEQNAPSDAELRLLQEIETAQAELERATTALQEARGRCEHRFRLEDPSINTATGEAAYPDHPTCLVCGSEFEHDWYCPKAPGLTCAYPTLTVGKFNRGRDLAAIHHQGDVECIHCGKTWARES